MIIKIDETILAINERRNFSCFWEAVDYFKLASYSELEAMMIAMELFNGEIWNKVINASKGDRNNNRMLFASGSTSFYSYSGMTTLTGNALGEQVHIKPDDIIVHLFVMTDKADVKLRPIYKSYIETREYEPIPHFEGHIKTITIELTTELAINLFNDGYKNL